MFSETIQHCQYIQSLRTLTDDICEVVTDSLFEIVTPSTLVATNVWQQWWQSGKTFPLSNCDHCFNVFYWGR